MSFIMTLFFAWMERISLKFLIRKQELLPF
nr:MAG TPA: hypothetical protein [Caudoviricetes sp.]